MARSGGRAATFTRDDVVSAGVRIGMAHLTVQAIADALGVTTAAVYRLVPSRSALETLIGEAILDELVLTDDPAEPAAEHLLDFASQLRRFTSARPGTAGYFLRVFPRGRSGVRLLETQIQALGRRGYDPAAATALSSATATVTLGITMAEESRVTYAGLDVDAPDESRSAMAGSSLIRAALREIPEHTPDDYFAFVVGSLTHGLVTRFPPGRPIRTEDF